jgi:PBSX family phage terminase large subunit
MIDWSDKQKSFFANSDHSFNILSGSVSSGKTYISNLRWYRHICEAPKNSLLVMIGKTAESLRDNCIRYLMDMDNNFSLDETKQPMRLYCKPNNVEVACAGGDNERSWQRIQGKTTAGAYFDEATTLPQTLVQNIAKGCRHQGKTWPKFFTCNPDHPSHYIKRRYIDNTKIDNRVWYFNLTDNPSLTPEYIEEVKQLYSGAMYDRMILGKWVMSEGVVFSEFTRDIHFFGNTDEKTFGEYIVGVDHGWENPLAMVLFGVDYDGNYYILDEIYKKHQHIDGSLKELVKSRGWLNLPRRISYFYADTNRPDLNQQLNRLFNYPVIPAIKDVIEGIQCVNGFFKRKRLFVHKSKVPEVVRELESYVWKSKTGTTIDDVVKENDHAMDAIRYAIYTREKARVKLVTSNPFRR